MKKSLAKRALNQPSELIISLCGEKIQHNQFLMIMCVCFIFFFTTRTKIYGLTQAKFQPDKCPAKRRELSEKKLSEN